MVDASACARATAAGVPEAAADEGGSRSAIHPAAGAMRRWSAVRRRTRPPDGALAPPAAAQSVVRSGAAISTPWPLLLVTKPSVVIVAPFHAPDSSTSAANASAASTDA